MSRSVMEKARKAQEQWKFSWWDSLIVAAAQISGCGILLTEDLQDGQDLEGLRTVDPFTHQVADILD